MKPTSSHALLAGVDGTEAVDAVLTASVGVGDVGVVALQNAGISDRRDRGSAPM